MVRPRRQNLRSAFAIHHGDKIVPIISRGDVREWKAVREDRQGRTISGGVHSADTAGFREGRKDYELTPGGVQDGKEQGGERGAGGAGRRSSEQQRCRDSVSTPFPRYAAARL